MPNRSLNVEAATYVPMDQGVKLTHVRLWPSLLSAAERLLDAGEHAAAIIVAQTACEVVVEKAMVKAKGPPAKSPLSYSLNGETMRKQYKAGTGDDIESQPFFGGYRQLVEDRNKAVHAGHQVDRDSAQKDIDAAKAFVQHVAQHNGLP